MKIKRNAGKLIIEIPESHILSGVRHHPTTAIKVTDKEKFLDAFARNVRSMADPYGSDEEALTVFLDAVAMQCVEDDEGVEVDEKRQR